MVQNFDYYNKCEKEIKLRKHRFYPNFVWRLNRFKEEHDTFEDDSEDTEAKKVVAASLRCNQCKFKVHGRSQLSEEE